MNDTVLLSLLVAGQVFTWAFLSTKMSNLHVDLARRIQKGSRR